MQIMQYTNLQPKKKRSRLKQLLPAEYVLFFHTSEDAIISKYARKQNFSAC